MKTIALTCAMVLASTLGCASSAYQHAIDNIDAVMNRYDTAVATGMSAGAKSEADLLTVKQQEGGGRNLPWAAARFCLERAQDNAGSAKVSTGADAFLLIAAGVTAGIGTGSYAASSLIDDSGKRKDWAQSGAINVAAAAGLLGLRAALDLGSVGREQRLAAADQVEGAIAVLQQAALGLDEDDLILKSFRGCGDGDRNVARALARTDTTSKLEKLISDAKDSAKTAEKQKESAKEKEANAAADLTKGNSPVEKAKADTAIAEAVTEQAEADVAIARGTVAEARQHVLEAGVNLRRALLFFTTADVTLAVAQLNSSYNEVLQAQKAVDDAKTHLEKAKARSHAARQNLQQLK